MTSSSDALPLSTLLPLPLPLGHQALGVTWQHPALGQRSRRFAMLIDNNVVKVFNVEQTGEFAVSSAEVILSAL